MNENLWNKRMVFYNFAFGTKSTRHVRFRHADSIKLTKPKIKPTLYIR